MDIPNVVTFSIVIPTYNESENIIRLITEIEKNLPKSDFTEIIIVDDNSPDGTGKLVENYINPYHEFPWHSMEPRTFQFNLMIALN
jgi:dolichol-phosphate mannosyltransferase